MWVLTVDAPYSAPDAVRFTRSGEPPSETEPASTAARITVVTTAVLSLAFRPNAQGGTSRLGRDIAYLSDEALVALVARRDEEALAALYDRFGRVAYGLALRVLRDASLAEDAVQEAFMTVWRSADRYMPERGKASSWILTFAHRRAVDLVRREERRRAEPLGEREAPGQAPAPDEESWLRLRREQVQEALRALPDQQREALELAYFGGFTQSELAERLGQPLGTIKSRMFTGLARLRELLEETETEPWHTTPSTT